MGRPFDIAEKQSFSGSMCSAVRVMFSQQQRYWQITS